MKITCQACQSKYTIADDKIQGKVAKIRCKKCGATVLVDASAASHGEAAPNVPPETVQTGAENVAGAGMWSVAIGEGEPRSMTLQEVIDAYNTGSITSETYVWKDGMADWLMLAQCEEIASVLRGGVHPSSSVAEGAAPGARPNVTGNGAAPNGASSAADAAAAAMRREPARVRGDDIFAGGTEDEEIATSVPPNVVARAASAAAARSAAGATAGSGASMSGLAGSMTSAVAPAAVSSTTGTYSAVNSLTTTSTTATSTKSPDEQSLLFSLSALTSGSASNGAGASSAPKSSNEESGLIDLNALAKAQEAHPSSASSASPMASPLFPAPFLFPAALGAPEAPQAEVDAPQKKKSKGPLIAVAAVAVAGVVALVAVLSSRGTESVAVAPPPEVTVPPPPPEPTATQTAEVAPTPSAAQSAKKVAAPAGGGVRKRPAGASGAEPAAAAPAAAPAAPATPQRGKCGCLSSDLQCQIRCSATGK